MAIVLMSNSLIWCSPSRLKSIAFVMGLLLLMILTAQYDSAFAQSPPDSNDDSSAAPQANETLDKDNDTSPTELDSPDEEETARSAAIPAAEEPGEEIEPLPEDTVQADPWLDLQGFSDLFSGDKFTGEARFRVPLKLPPGRRGLTPDLELTYSSFNDDFVAPYGFGFELSVSSIFRSTRHGIDKLYTPDDFSASIAGKNNELVSVDGPAGLFMGKSGNDFSRYVFQDGSWEVTDTQGNIYRFGAKDSSRVSDPDNPAHISQWMLDQIMDPMGNRIEFTYLIDHGYPYLDKIQYAFIGNNESLFRIELDYLQKPSSPISYRSGFSIQALLLLNRVDVQENVNSVWKTQRSYRFAYDDSDKPVSRLVQISQEADGNILPPIQLSYHKIGSSIGLLRSISNGGGGDITLEYLPSTAYRNEGAIANQLPFILQTLHRASYRDLVTGIVATTTNTFSGGHYFYDQIDVRTREFAGFHKVVSQDDTGVTTKTYFHQSQFSPDNAVSSASGEFEDHIDKKGRQYRQEIYDGAGNLYTVSISKWDRTDLGNGRSLVVKQSGVALNFDGDTTHRDLAEEFNYDRFGNVTVRVAWGEVNANTSTGEFVDVGTDKTITNHSYALNEDRNLLTYISGSTLIDHDGITTLQNTRHYYDGLTMGQVSKGNLTKTEGWLNTDNTWVATSYVYNEQGMLLSVTNPRGFTSSKSYDEFNMYPSTSTDPMGHVVRSTYDYSSGQIQHITDPNGFVTAYDYDGFGRPLSIHISDQKQSPTLVIKTRFVYTDDKLPRSIHTTNRFSEDAIHETYQYLDGFGRLIQQRSSSDRDGQFIVASNTYDSRGRISREYQPYFASSSEYSEVSQPDTRATTYTYDSLDRPTLIETSVGSTTIVYHNWNVRTTDPENRVKTTHFDGFNRLVTVDEHNTNAVYTTSYEYDGSGNLTHITDAEGNVRAFTFDSLGRVVENELAHKPNVDGAIYSYEYDENSNRTTEIRPNGATILRSYDPLDRVSRIDDPSTEEIEVRYEYDNAVNGLRKLSKIITPTYVREYRYDLQGNLASEVHSFDTTISEPSILCIYDHDSNGKTRRAEALATVTDYLLQLQVSALGRPPSRQEAVEVVTSYLLQQTFVCVQ